jgi:hypothetical protein
VYVALAPCLVLAARPALTRTLDVGADDENRASLEMPPASTFTLSSARAGDELKRATILSSEDRVARIVVELGRLRELQGVLAQASQLQAGISSCGEQLRRLEGAAELAAERVLALHARVERVLAAYQQMVRVLSEKCVEYNELLEQLQV